MLTPLLCQGGETALNEARDRGHREVEALLLQHGTEEDEEDDDEADGEDDDDYYSADDDDYDPFFDEEYEEDDDELDFLSLLHMICAAL
jgi:hypothetical protein